MEATQRFLGRLFLCLPMAVNLHLTVTQVATILEGQAGVFPPLRYRQASVLVLQHPLGDHSTMYVCSRTSAFSSQSTSLAHNLCVPQTSWLQIGVLSGFSPW
jgi:hypothetical protein